MHFLLAKRHGRPQTRRVAWAVSRVVLSRDSQTAPVHGRFVSWIAEMISKAAAKRVRDMTDTSWERKRR